MQFNATIDICDFCYRQHHRLDGWLTFDFLSKVGVCECARCEAHVCQQCKQWSDEVCMLLWSLLPAHGLTFCWDCRFREIEQGTLIQDTNMTIDTLARLQHELIKYTISTNTTLPPTIIDDVIMRCDDELHWKQETTPSITAYDQVKIHSIEQVRQAMYSAAI